MRLLLTRPRTDDDRLAALLQSAGHELQHEPLLTIQPLPFASIETAGLQAVVATSAHALEAIEVSPELLAVPLFAVGPATARRARDKGFATLSEGPAGAAELADLMKRQLSRAGGTILYLRGEETAFAMEAALAEAGFDVASRIVYSAVPVAALGPGTVHGLAGGHIQGVVLLSPRTAQTYARLTAEAGLTGALRHIPHYGLSDRVVLPLKHLGITTIRVPVQPSLQELVALIAAEATQCPAKA